jgi:hypothetical protein
MVSGGGLQALPQAWSAISKVQSALGADTERIQSGGAWRRTPGAPTGLECDLKSSERTPSGYRADTERIQSGYRAHSERIQSGYRADTECKKSAGAEENCPTLVRSE